LEQVTNGLFDQGKRAIAHGTCPQVGIGGHATIGGQGPLSRMWGLTLDHVLEMEVVLADGTITRASKSQNSDLFFVSVLRDPCPSFLCFADQNVSDIFHRP
jgi:FAD/FMN-containing dehydrogenase